MNFYFWQPDGWRSPKNATLNILKFFLKCMAELAINKVKGMLPGQE